MEIKEIEFYLEQIRNNKKIRNDYIQKTIGEYFIKILIKTNSTIRYVADITNIPKSTVFNYIKKIQKLNPPLYKEARKILDKNLNERHLRGGYAYKRKLLLNK